MRCRLRPLAPQQTYRSVRASVHRGYPLADRVFDRADPVDLCGLRDRGTQSRASPRDEPGLLGRPLRGSTGQHLENTKLQDDHGGDAQRGNDKPEA